MRDHLPGPASLAAPAVIERAVITGSETGTSRSLHDPARWMRGAVHDHEGALVVASQRVWSRDNPNAPVATDPDRVRPPGNPERLTGTWLYAGHWSRHFGHFLVEVLPTLWPERTPGLAGVVAHRSFRQHTVRQPFGRMQSAELQPWQADLLALAGYADLPVQVVRGRAVLVDALVVPERPVVFRTVARPEAVALWRRMAAAAGPPTAEGARVFLSRRHFHVDAAPKSRRTTADWDAELERTFEAAGYLVLHPERLSVLEQVRAVAGASVLAGSAGSALHQAVFCRPGTRVVEVGDARSPDAPQSSQAMLTAACEHRAGFAPFLDLDAVRELAWQA